VAGAGLLFALGFVLAACALHLLVGEPLSLYAAYRSEKLALLASEGHASCSAAFGTSHVHNGFDPRAFDSALAGEGVFVRSLNLGIEGGSQGEQYLMAEVFLSDPARFTAHGGGPCLLLLEANAGVNMQAGNFVHPRAINTYNDAVTTLTLDFDTPALAPERRLGRAAFAALGSVLYHANTGMLASRLFPHALDAALLQRQTVADQRGLLVEPSNPRELAAVAQAVAARPPAPELRPGLLTPGHGALVAGLLRRAGTAGVEVVYVVTPKISDLVQAEVYPPCIAVEGRRVPVLDMALPSVYPALYQAGLWHDLAHLNAAGAAEYSDKLAHALAAARAHDDSTSDCARP
jgi:hypothetical protein